MPVNGFTVGRDVTVTIAGPGGVTIVIPSEQVTHFDRKPVKRQVWSRPLNNPPRPIYMPDGWQGTIEIDRQDRSLDDFQAGLEADFWAGKNTLGGTVLETITETDGSISQYRFDGAMFWVEEPGSYKAEDRVTQRIEFCAGTRKKV